MDQKGSQYGNGSDADVSGDGVAGCPIVQFNDLVQGKYKLRILWEVRKSPRRYTEILRALRDATGGRNVTPRVLSRELKSLESSGLLHRRPFPVVPPRVEYSATPRSRKMPPVMNAICRWADRDSA